jgi:hypothetical protein
MNPGRLQNKAPLNDADSPHADETPMTASRMDERPFVDRRLRNRLLLLNAAAWVVILSIIYWVA